jgi:hypothetical protein
MCVCMCVCVCVRACVPVCVCVEGGDLGGREGRGNARCRPGGDNNGQQDTASFPVGVIPAPPTTKNSESVSPFQVCCSNGEATSVALLHIGSLVCLQIFGSNTTSCHTRAQKRKHMCKCKRPHACTVLFPHATIIRKGTQTHTHTHARARARTQYTRR